MSTEVHTTEACVMSPAGESQTFFITYELAHQGKHEFDLELRATTQVCRDGRLQRILLRSHWLDAALFDAAVDDAYDRVRRAQDEQENRKEPS